MVLAASSGDRPVAVDPVGHLAHSSTEKTTFAKVQYHRSHISLSEFVAVRLYLARKWILEIFALDYRIWDGILTNAFVFLSFC